MFRILTVNIPEFLNRKFLEWQVQEGERKTIGEFAELFSASQSVMSQWMTGERSPGPKYKKRIIERYGEEAVRAFGEDPDLHYIQENWENYTQAERRALREKAEQYKAGNETKRLPERRRTKTP